MFLNFNGKLSESTHRVLTASNRAFSYGDGLFETMRVRNGKILYLPDHQKRLAHGLRLLHLQAPPLLEGSGLEEMVSGLVIQNKLDHARVRLQVFREEGGYFIPEKKSALFIITATALHDDQYKLNEQGLRIDVFGEYPVYPSPLAQVKKVSAVHQVLAGIYCREQQLDECVMINTRGFLTEGVSSNFFLVRNRVVYTPPLEDGCLGGVMRRQALRLLPALGLDVKEQSLMPDELLTADELFFTNVISGIKWVVAYKKKRYYHHTAKKLVEKLNERMFKV